MDKFSAIRRRAEKRKGGAEALSALVPDKVDNADLANVPDNRILAQMTERIFCSGFVWSVIKAKWAGFEAAFLNFEPDALLFQPDEFWESLVSDKRVIRHGAKIMAVQANAQFIRQIGAEHGSFGNFLSKWPRDDQFGLLQLLGKQGTRLGGMTGQYFLRFIGWDTFILSQDVIQTLRDAGVELSEKASSKRDLLAVQGAFNKWAAETGLAYTQLSRICAMASGANNPPAQIRRAMQH